MGRLRFSEGEEGTLFVIQAGPKFQVLEQIDLNGEMCLATPALVRDSVLVRTERGLYRLGVKK